MEAGTGGEAGGFSAALKTNLGQGKGLEDELDKLHSLENEAQGLEDGPGGLSDRDCMNCRTWDN